jgi:hypothetical protein
MTIKLAIDNTSRRPPPVSTESILRQAITASAPDLACAVVTLRKQEARAASEAREAPRHVSDLRLALTGIGYARFGLMFSRALIQLEIP